MNKEFLTQTVRGNTKIIDRDDYWNLLLYKEAYHTKLSAIIFEHRFKSQLIENFAYSLNSIVFVLHFHVLNYAMYRLQYFNFCYLSCTSVWRGYIELYRNIISKRFFAIVACIIVTMHLLGITFFLWVDVSIKTFCSDTHNLFIQANNFSSGRLLLALSGKEGNLEFEQWSGNDKKFSHMK